ncbi:OmpA family protein [Aliiroseovarius marinus]|uniref:OmpA family protein n=1 Tax=Aliiroseovarius marinus TaxID=2500159 RepID=UPI003D7F0A9E
MTNIMGKTGNALRVSGLVVASALLFPIAAGALSLPAGAIKQAEDVQIGQTDLARARFDGSAVPRRTVEGRITRQAWKLSGDSRTSFQILQDLRRQLTDDGFEPLLQCQSVSCGGFDFRFAVGHFKAPEMFVDLGDYHYLSASNGDQHASVLVSRAQADAYVELTLVAPADAAATNVDTGATPVTTPTIIPPSGPLQAQLDSAGHAVLSGLSFATGSATLAEGDSPSLAELARYLTDHPTRQVALVGHTDAQGGLEGNVALSQKRANAVRIRLIEQYGVKPDQLSAEGIGYLAPRAANLTTEGRDANRRVEAVLISTE